MFFSAVRGIAPIVRDPTTQITMTDETGQLPNFDGYSKQLENVPVAPLPRSIFPFEDVRIIRDAAIATVAYFECASKNTCPVRRSRQAVRHFL